MAGIGLAPPQAWLDSLTSTCSIDKMFDDTGDSEDDCMDGRGMDLLGWSSSDDEELEETEFERQFRQALQAWHKQRELIYVKERKEGELYAKRMRNRPRLRLKIALIERGPDVGNNGIASILCYGTTESGGIVECREFHLRSLPCMTGPRQHQFVDPDAEFSKAYRRALVRSWENKKPVRKAMRNFENWLTRLDAKYNVDFVFWRHSSLRFLVEYVKMFGYDDLFKVRRKLGNYERPDMARRAICMSDGPVPTRIEELAAAPLRNLKSIM